MDDPLAIDEIEVKRICIAKKMLMKLSAGVKFD